MTLEDRLVFDLPCWKRISSSVKDLLIKLLAKDPCERITLDQAIAHPWFQNSRMKFGAGSATERGCGDQDASKQMPLKKSMPLNKESSFIQKVTSSAAN